MCGRLRPRATARSTDAGISSVRSWKLSADSRHTVAWGARSETANKLSCAVGGAPANRHTPRDSETTMPSSRSSYSFHRGTPRSAACEVVKLGGS